MEKTSLQVQLFGRCAITANEIRIADDTKRPSKNWLLIAYLIHHRGTVTTREELIRQIYEEELSSNSDGALKTTLWRARALLDALWPSAGRELIVTKSNGYEWNPDISMTVDVEEFEKHCYMAAYVKSVEEKREHLRAAVALYQGNFLERFSGESWVEPLTAYYSNLYVTGVLDLCEILPPDVYGKEVLTLTEAALRTSPYNERLYQYRIKALMARQEYKRADEVYGQLQELLYANLGVMPDEESQALRRELVRRLSYGSLTVDMLRDQLQEKNPDAGPLFCDFSVFKQFYQAEARSVTRRGDAVHVAMLTVSASDGKDLSEQAMEKIMENLRVKLRSGLRRGDIVSRCSTAQYVILLLQANFENSNKVCERIIKSYTQTHGSKVYIHAVVLPVEPLQWATQNTDDGKRTKRIGWNTT